MGIRIGIDLGTSNSGVAYRNRDSNQVEMLRNHNDKTTTPSVLAFLEDGTVLHGEDAKELQAQGYSNSISFFKRHMGNDHYEVEFFGKVYSATDLSALFLQKLVKEAEEILGESVEEAVITVPAYFRHKEREATLQAAKQANLIVKEIINEPTAAALAYGIHGKAIPQTILIYDLGGGTLDVTIARISKESVQVVGIDGNHRLGGKEWDDAIARWASKQYIREFAEDFFEEEDVLSKLMHDAEYAKKQLSAASNTIISIGNGKKKGRYQLSLSLFEELTKPLLELTYDCIKRLFRTTKTSWKDLNGILLVGGASKMKMVHEYLQKVSGVPVLYGINPMEAVALGAAMKANADLTEAEMIRKQPPTEKLLPKMKEFLVQKKVEEVIAHSLGMLSINDTGDRYVNSILIPKNSRIPSSRTKSYLYYTKEQENELDVYLVQGEEESPSECEIVGKYVFSEIAFLPGSKSTIDITYTYNENGIIEVEARQRETKRQLAMRVEEVPQELDWIKENPQSQQTKTAVPTQRVIYVAIDLSGSMKGRPLLAAKNAIYHFVHELNLAYCKVGIIAFADRAKLVLPPTNHLNLLEQMIKGIHLNYKELGYCNDCDPFDLIYREFERLDDMEGLLNKCAIVMTDGMWSYPEEAIAAARKCHKEEIEVIALGFGQAKTGFLRQIASYSNLGKFIELEELTIQFSKIAQVMR